MRWSSQAGAWRGPCHENRDAGWESQGGDKVPLNSLTPAGLAGLQLQPRLLRCLGLPWQRWGGTAVPHLPPLACAVRLLSVSPGSLGRAVLHAGPGSWALWVYLKVLSILTFVLAACPASQPVQMKGHFSPNLGDSITRSLVLLTPKAQKRNIGTSPQLSFF